jgi:hypothetical protein
VRLLLIEKKLGVRDGLIAGRMWGVTKAVEVANIYRGGGALSARIDYLGAMAKCKVSAVGIVKYCSLAHSEFSESSPYC